VFVCQPSTGTRTSWEVELNQTKRCDLDGIWGGDEKADGCGCGAGALLYIPPSGLFAVVYSCFLIGQGIQRRCAQVERQARTGTRHRPGLRAVSVSGPSTAPEGSGHADPPIRNIHPRPPLVGAGSL
jgi:hypothetical protein